MADPPLPLQQAANLAARVAGVEARLERLEALLAREPVPARPEATNGFAVEGETPAPLPGRTLGDQLERQIDQRAFALAGVIALTSGLAFLLSLPHARLPAAAPALAGVALSSALLVGAHLFRGKLAVLGRYVRGAAMLLLYFSTLRFCYFGRPPALEPGSLAGSALLGLATAVNAALAWRARSRWLVCMALLMGAATGLTMGSGVLFVAWLPLLAAAAVLTGWRWNWPGLALAALPLIHATYFLWAIGNPILRRGVRFVGEQPAAPGMLLAIAGLFAMGSLQRPDREREDGPEATAALLNCVLGYGAFLVHTAAAYPDSFVALQTATFLVFLALAVLWWTAARAVVSTFFYAITGYIALSMAILKAASSPNVFVWLSGQSLVVLATAIWFRSRLMVVANFLIYAAVVLAYVFFVKRETGVSLGFGIVALVSARLLNWQQERLELKTGLMRNAYLLSAFIVFPYALQHLAPIRYVALTWIGLAVGYYALSHLARNQKYRWMAHATLALSALYLLVAALEPAWRIASFLTLGTVLLIVSLTVRNSRV